MFTRNKRSAARLDCPLKLSNPHPLAVIASTIFEYRDYLLLNV